MTGKNKEYKYNWSGERLETFIFNDGMLEHLHRYALTLPIVKGKNVLDIACGEGYGANLLSEFANKVTAVDINKETVEKAALKYKNKNLEFITGSATSLSLPDHSVDIVVSFETLEHLSEHDLMLRELKRVLRPDGILIISTPDKLNYADRNILKNPYHVKELYEAEFKALINSYFKNTAFYQQKSSFSSIITTFHSNNNITLLSGDYHHINQNCEFEPYYHIAIATENEELPIFSCPSVFRGLPTYDSIIEQAETNVKSSITYRTGHFILSPVKLIRRFLKKIFPAKK